MNIINRAHIMHPSRPATTTRAALTVVMVAIAGATFLARTKAAALVTANPLPPLASKSGGSADAHLAMTIPSQPGETEVLEIKPDESAFVSVATMHAEVPVADWAAAGWSVGPVIAEADPVPLDCALHARRGIARQVVAACPGQRRIAIPPAGGDFVYVVFTGSDKQVTRVLRTGALYNPDTTGLIP